MSKAVIALLPLALAVLACAPTAIGPSAAPTPTASPRPTVRPTVGPTVAPIATANTDADLARARGNVAKLIEFVHGIETLDADRLPEAADPYWAGIREIVLTDMFWVSDSEIPAAARDAYRSALTGLFATDQLVSQQSSDQDKALAMLVGLRDDLTALDVARITLK